MSTCPFVQTDQRIGSTQHECMSPVETTEYASDIPIAPKCKRGCQGFLKIGER